MSARPQRHSAAWGLTCSARAYWPANKGRAGTRALLRKKTKQNKNVILSNDITDGKWFHCDHQLTCVFSLTGAPVYHWGRPLRGLTLTGSCALLLSTPQSGPKSHTGVSKGTTVSNWILYISLVFLKHVWKRPCQYYRVRINKSFPLVFERPTPHQQPLNITILNEFWCVGLE